MQRPLLALPATRLVLCPSQQWSGQSLLSTGHVSLLTGWHYCSGKPLDPSWMSVATSGTALTVLHWSCATSPARLQRALPHASLLHTPLWLTLLPLWLAQYSLSSNRSFCRLQPGMWYRCCIAWPETHPHLPSCSVASRLRLRSVNPGFPLDVLIGMEPAGRPSP